MNLRVARSVALTATLVAMSPLCGSVAAAPGDGAAEKVFVGYLFGENRNIDFKLYSHICHAFLTADAEGNVRGGRNVPSKELTGSAHKAGVKVLVSLGGWGWDRQFAAIVKKPEAEERYATAVLKIVDTNDYDGIDFDWEYPDTKEEVVGFERLVRRFRKELDELGKKKGWPMFLTFAASSHPGTLRWVTNELILENLDWINVMTYDYTGDWTDFAGHHSPLFASSKQPAGNRASAEATFKYLLEERKLPADRLALGIPLYGRGFPVSEPYASTKNIAKKRMPQGNYRNIEKLLREQKWTRVFDPETKNPWAISPDHSMVIGYDDAESVALKTEWALKKGLRGVFFWEIHADRLPDGSHPLQEASRKALDAGGKPAKSN